MTWQTIDSAPSGVAVMLGRWSVDYARNLFWQTDIGAAWLPMWFGLLRCRHAGYDRFTHWKPLPSPPDAPE